MKLDEAAKLIEGVVDGVSVLCLPETEVQPGATAEVFGFFDEPLCIGHWELVVASKGSDDFYLIASYREDDGVWREFKWETCRLPARWFFADAFKGGGFSICKVPPDVRFGLRVANDGSTARIFRAGIKRLDPYTLSIYQKWLVREK